MSDEEFVAKVQQADAMYNAASDLHMAALQAEAAYHKAADAHRRASEAYSKFCEQTVGNGKVRDALVENGPIVVDYRMESFRELMRKCHSIAARAIIRTHTDAGSASSE